MIEYERVISLIIEEGKSFTPHEREKAAGPYDAIYLKEKIKHHSLRVQLLRAIVLLLYITLGVAILTVFFYPENPTSQKWIKGTLILLCVLCLLGLPYLFKNHGRNASLLRLVHRLRQIEQEQKTIQQNALAEKPKTV